MANFMVVVDPDAERRSRFIKTVEPIIAPVEGLTTGMCETADFSAVWAILPAAPFSQSVDADGAAVIWGEAIEAASPRRQDAPGLRRLWKKPAPKLPAYDGFYSAVVYSPTVGLCASADLLGLFPLYYFDDTDVLLVASSPELMQWHPIFKKKLSCAGLVGLLLTNGIFDGKTLWQNVYRLAAGYALVWSGEGQPDEVEQYTIPFSNQYINLPYSRVTEPLDAALRNAVARHAPVEESYSLLLSGGLDSRMIGGYLQENGNQVTALTYGLPTDIEMQCAAKVARTLGFGHRAVEVTPEQCPACADVAAKWEHLASGFCMISDWGTLSALRPLAPRVVSGLLVDAIVGCDDIDAGNLTSFARNINVWGANPETLKTLSPHRAFRELVEHTWSRIDEVFQDAAEYDFQRAWRFWLCHIERFHVGAAAWRFSFGAWPVLPILDRELLKTVAGFPTAAIAERRAQQSLVSERFPALARLPLDRSDYDSRPLQPRIRQQLAWHMSSKIAPLWRKVQQFTGTASECRYVYRIMDFNWAGWQTVRHHAEPYRNRLFDLFAEDTLARLLPPPYTDVHFENPLKGSAWLKNMLGLMLFDRDATLSFE